MGDLQICADLEKNRSERLRIALDRYAGVDLIDLRLTVELTAGSGLRAPTKKGVSCRLAMLPDIIAGLQRAEALAREQGLLTEAGE
jgi:hypothetical protein